MLRVTSARMMPPWGHNARPYFFQGHYFTMMSYSRAKLWPGQFQRFWERKRITERQITQWALPVGLFYSYYRYLSYVDYCYHQKDHSLYMNDGAPKGEEAAEEDDE